MTEPDLEFENAILIEEGEILYYYIPELDIFYKTIYNKEGEREDVLLHEKGKDILELTKQEVSYLKLMKENITINI